MDEIIAQKQSEIEDLRDLVADLENNIREKINEAGSV